MERALVDDVPTRRLGEMLRSARKRRGWKRRQSAAMVRITTGELRAYERGERRIPSDVWERLSDCYGNDLAGQIATRVAPAVDDNAVVAGGHERDVRNGDVVGAYVAVLRQLRHAKPGASVPVRAADLAALASALDADPGSVEQQIIDAIGCTRSEARALYAELLQRRIIVPVAGLAAGVVLLAGVHAAQAAVEDHRPAAPPARAVPAVTVPAPVVAPPTTDVTLSTTPPTVPVVSATPVPSITPVRSTTRSPVLTPPDTIASPPDVTPTTTTTSTPPSIPEDDTPEGVPPGEHPRFHP